jgi:hypothetical protein
VAPIRSSSEFAEVDRLFRWGLNDCQIARLTGIPRRTVCDWRQQASVQSRTHVAGTVWPRSDVDCPACAGATVPARPYAYLLGMYLGDGCISRTPRTFHLRVSLDARYPAIIDECARSIRAVRPGKQMPVGRVKAPGCIVLSAHWNHWPCMFPQHGRGPKHRRQIRLVPWQEGIAEANPDLLLRGLIHSDGCRVINRVNGGEYPRYMFTNHSDDIRAIFAMACDAFSVTHRRMNWRTLAVSRAEDVARLDTVIGPKS